MLDLEGRHRNISAPFALEAKQQPDPLDLESLLAMARLSRGLKNDQEAMQYFQLAFEMQPRFSVLVEWAGALSDFGHHPQALELYRTAIDQLELDGEQLFEVYKNIGNIYLREQDLESAEENYNRAFVLNPESEALLINMATLDLQRQQYDSALDRFRTCILKNRNNERAWIGLALAHRHYGDHELAWANLIEAMDLSPAGSTALQLLVDWAYRDGRLQAAVEFVERALKERPRDAVLILLLAQLLFDLGACVEARDRVKTAMSIAPYLPGASELKSLVENRLEAVSSCSAS